MVSDNQSVEIAGNRWFRMESVRSNGLVSIEKWGDGHRQYCVKHGRGQAVEMLEYEALGLEMLANSRSVTVPKIHKQEDGILATEWIDHWSPSGDDWETLGSELANLHHQPHHSFGLEQDGFCGNNRQPNQWCLDGFEFFATQRIEPQMKMARDSGLLGREDCAAITGLVRKFPDLIPKQPAVLIHGDLWSGNVLFGRFGPCLIDPAVHYGWAEADLAMTCLFGGFDQKFYDAYENTTNLEPGFEKRKDIYNCYHLLNHLNLFGSSYHNSLMSIVKRFSSNTAL